MNKLILLFIALCLSGCATTVHLVTKGYSAEEVSQFEQQLINKGFDVEISIPKLHEDARFQQVEKRAKY